MPNDQRNRLFLIAIDEATKNEILDAIAAHYGITREAAHEEVTSHGCEHLLDYLPGGPLRAAASLLFKRHGLATS